MGPKSAWVSKTGGSVAGFTYELLEELEGRFFLSDFLGDGGDNITPR